MAVDVTQRAKAATHYRDTVSGQLWADCSAHDQHYLEAGVWTPVVEAWVADSSVQGFSYKSDRHGHRALAGGNSNRRWYPRRDSPEYVEAARPQYWDGSRWRNLSLGTMTVSGGTVTFTSTTQIVALSVLWSGIRITLTLRTSAAYTRFRWPLSFSGLAYDSTTGDLTLGTAGGLWVGRITPPTAHDANGNPVAVTTAWDGTNLDWTITTTGATFPITVDPDFTTLDASAGSDGYIGSDGSPYATVRSTAGWGDKTSAWVSFGQYQTNGYYQTHRGYVGFDTSSIGLDKTVTQVNLKMTPVELYTGTFDIQIVKQNYSYNWGPDLQADYAGCLSGEGDLSIWHSRSGLVVNTQYASGNLATDWIVKNGTTKYSLRSSDDYNGTPAPIWTTQWVRIAASRHATAAYRPVLTVVYSAATAKVPLFMHHYATRRAD